MPAPTLDDRLSVRNPPAGRRAVMYQQWRNLLFLHWEIEPEIIQQSLPPGLTVDTFEGRAYLGLVPFFMQGIRPRGLPAVPGLSRFQEVNVRTYVYDESGTPGVWFYSLDANQWLAVRIARRFFHLPYFDARMSFSDESGVIEYDSHRRTPEHRESSRFRYGGREECGTAEPGSLDFFLVERYILFAHDRRRNRLFSGQVHHCPYPLCEVDVSEQDASLLELAGFAAPGRPPDLAHMSRGVDVDIYSLQQLPQPAGVLC